MKTSPSKVVYKGMTISYSQEPDPKQCKAITKKGSQCKNKHLDDDEFCFIHSEKKEIKAKKGEIVICQGIKRDKNPCKRAAVAGSLYCREDHNPEFWASPTGIFRKPNLRDLVEEQVKELTDRKDVYTGLPLQEPGLPYHLEHYFEMNIVRDIFDFSTKNAKENEANSLKLSMRDTFNQVFNLGFTEEPANQAKCAAVVEFANDLKFSEVHCDGLPHYLRKRFTGKSVTRGDIARVATRIVTAYDSLKDFSEQKYGGSSLHEKAMDRLDFTFEKMNLQK